MSLLALSAAILATATGYYRYATARDPVHAAESPRAETAVAAASDGADEVARLQRRVRQLQQKIGELSSEATPPGPESAADSIEESVLPPTPEQEAAWLEARARFFDQHLEQQARDEEWASALEVKAATETEKQKELGVTLEEAKCWSTACRLTFVYPSGTARSRHVYTLGRLYPELPVVSYAYPGEPEVHTRAVAYMAKDSLPEFEFTGVPANGPDEAHPRTNN